MIRRPPRSTPLYSSAASDVYKRQPIGRVGPLRRAKAEPVDQHDASALGKAQRQGRQLDARTGRIEAVQEQDRPPLAQPVARDPTGIGVQIEWVAMNGRG